LQESNLTSRQLRWPSDHVQRATTSERHAQGPYVVASLRF